MAIDYQSSFNSGELSGRMNGRSGLEVYKNGCSRLENFYVLPQGGVERRTGTEFITKSGGASIAKALGGNAYAIGDQALEAGITYECNTGETTASLIDGDWTAVGATAWAAITEYDEGDVVQNDSIIYTCLIDHESTADFADDIGLWSVLLYAPIKSDTDYLSGAEVSQGGTNYVANTDTTTDKVLDSNAKWDVVSVYGVNKSRLIPFVFSSTQAYVAEIGLGYITMWDTDGNSYPVTGTVPYALDEFDEIEFSQQFDTSYLSHPNHQIRLLKRINLDPEFTIEEMQFDFPPFTDPLDDTVSLTPDGTVGDITITSNKDAFVPGMVDSYLLFFQSRGVGQEYSGHRDWYPGSSPEVDIYGKFWSAQVSGATQNVTQLQKKVGGTWQVVQINGQNNQYGSWEYNSDTKGLVSEEIRILFLYTMGTYYFRVASDQTSSVGGPLTEVTQEIINVSHSRWTLRTNGNDWEGRIVIQRSTDGGNIWNDHIVVIDTTGSPTTNTVYESPSYEKADTYVRVKFAGTATEGTYTISSNDVFQTGIAKITGYNSERSVDAVVTSSLVDINETIQWKQSAFSKLRGYPRSLAFHEDRLWIAGSGTDPAIIYASTSGDYSNFQTGATSDMGIERIPNNPELAQWMVGRNELIMGTEGGAIAIRSVDKNELIDASNIVTASQAVFGSSEVTAIEANDTVVYSERGGKKIRELIYDDNEANYRSQDMNILNRDILSGEVKGLFLQQQPDQIIYAVQEDGSMAHLTYERVQEVVGWGRYVTNGSVSSACRIPSANSEDEIWMCVNRNGVYTIEKSKPRADANWYVDSGVEGGLVETKVAGLDHLEGLEVRCVVDGLNDGLYTVSGGEITPTTQTGTKYTIGLDYDSILRTMPIEPTLVSKLPNSRVKGAVKCVTEFETTTGGSVREKGKTGEIFDEVEFSGEKKFNIASDWTREKVIEIKQHLPYPMTILSLAVWTEVKGG